MRMRRGKATMGGGGGVGGGGGGGGNGGGAEDELLGALRNQPGKALIF